MSSSDSPSDDDDDDVEIAPATPQMHKNLKNPASKRSSEDGEDEARKKSKSPVPPQDQLQSTLLEGESGGGNGGGGNGGGGNGGGGNGGGGGSGPNTFNVLEALLQGTLTDDRRASFSNEPHLLDTSDLPSHIKLKDLEDATVGRFFIWAATLASSLSTVNLLVVFDFPPTDQGMEQGGMLKTKYGIPTNATMYAFYSAYAQVISRQYCIDIRVAWMVALQSVVVVDAYPFTLAYDFATNDPTRFKEMQSEIANESKAYINDICRILNDPQIMLIGVKTHDFVMDHSIIPLDKITQPGSAIHTSKLIQGPSSRQLFDLYASINRTLARTQHEQQARSFTAGDAICLAWPVEMSENFTDGKDDFIYKLTDINGVTLFLSQGASSLNKDIARLGLPLNSNSLPPQRDICNESINTTFFDLNITLVPFNEYGDYGNLSKKFGPQESPALRAWLAGQVKAIENKRDAIAQASRTKYSVGASNVLGAESP